MILCLSGLLMACPPNLDAKGYTPCASDAECAAGPDGLARICTEGVCTPSRCGDGVVSADEECDDTNDVNTDGCTNGCRLPRCGDGITTIDENLPADEREQCDDGNSANDDGCTSSCRRARCGDGTVRQDLDPIDDLYEECDDGNDIDTDGCNRCQDAFCGDGAMRADLQAGDENYEECDDGDNINTDGCTSTCELPRCGDGYLRTDLSSNQEGYEECDDGNLDDGDSCSSSCELPGCGDGVTQEGEECDDGNDIDSDACTTACKSATCGDNVVQPGNDEECDDANAVQTDGCLNNCHFARCGDGFRRTDRPAHDDNFEECDDGPENNNDACTNLCELARCGDGINRADLAPGQVGYEACDDGNVENDDACLNNCQEAVCNDGVIRRDILPGQDGFEACDDLNFVDTDGCTNSCKVARCGDDIVRRDLGENDPNFEECEDGNNNNQDACTNRCRSARCGDGIVRGDREQGQLGFEACDDGEDNNNALADACRTNCRPAACGDRVVDAGEDCDDGDDDDRDACLSCVEARCGDGVLRLDLGPNDDAFEQCDDGNRIDNDDCNNNCVAPACGDGRRLGNEECDDGNLVNEDACTAECVLARCGDGILREDLVNPAAEGFEACDEGANNGDIADTCRANCLLPRCGDGIIDAAREEGCDPGPDGDWSDCSRLSCKPPRRRLAVSERYVCVWPEESETLQCWGLDDPLYRWHERGERAQSVCFNAWPPVNCYVNETIELRYDEGIEGSNLPRANGWRSLQAVDEGLCMNTEYGVWCMGQLARLNNQGRLEKTSILPNLWGGWNPQGMGNQMHGGDNSNRVLAYHSADSHGCHISRWNQADENEPEDWSPAELRCWGTNDKGQLGNGTTDDAEGEVEVMTLDGAQPVDVFTSTDTSCALTEGGGLWCWGNRASGVAPAGQDCGNNEGNCEPTRVAGLTDVRRVWLGDSNICVVTGDEARLHCWGMADNGQLGLAPEHEDLERCSPRNDEFEYACLRRPRDLGMVGIEDLALGDGFICRLIEGRVRCWGADGYGELGIGLEDLQEDPWFHLVPDNDVDVDLPGTVSEISTWYGTVCALLDDGRVYCWGSNGYGRVGRLGANEYGSPQFVEIPR